MGKYGFLFPLLLLLGACQHNDTAEAHSHDEPGEHTHDEGDSHSHDEPLKKQITTWNQHMELFIEHDLLVADAPTEWAVHVTRMDGHQNRGTGAFSFTLTMEGAEPITITKDQPTRPGIYVVTVTLPNPGVWSGVMQVTIDNTITEQHFPAMPVFSTEEDAAYMAGQSAPEGESITFLKEQQWRIPFSTAPVTTHTFRQSLIANGVIGPQYGGEALIHAPTGGRLLSTSTPLPYIGTSVRKGQKLASIIPNLGEAEDRASLWLDLKRAELDRDYAEKEWNRLKELFANQIIPENQLQAAALALDEATAEVTAAKKRLNHFSALQQDTPGASDDRIDLYAPLSGTLIAAHAVSGALMEEGDLLYHIIDMNTIWLTVHIPESEIGKISQTPGAWFHVDGLDRVFEVNPEHGGRLIALGGMIDPRKRTLPLIFALPNPDKVLKIGMFARTAVLTGKSEDGPAIPLSAVVEEEGSPVAYVMVQGETFARRNLQLGIRDGDRIQVISGLKAGERVVTQGAYQVRLAASGPSVPDHGHTH